MENTTLFTKNEAQNTSQGHDQIAVLMKQLELPASIYPHQETFTRRWLGSATIAVGLSAAAGWMWWEWTGVAVALLADTILGCVAYRAHQVAEQNRDIKWFNQTKYIIPVFSLYKGDPTVDERTHYAKEMIALSKNPFKPAVMTWIFNDHAHWGESFENFLLRVYSEYVPANQNWLTYLNSNWKEKDANKSRDIFKQQILGQNPISTVNVQRHAWAAYFAKFRGKDRQIL